MARIKYAPTILLLCILCLSCNLNSGGANSASAPKTSQKNADENFDVFFSRFKTDSVFQKSRIRFPLKIKLTAGEGDIDSTNLIPAGSLPYINLFTVNGAKRIVKKTVLSPVKVDVLFQLQDNGFEENFTFVKKAGQWNLVLIVDESD
ncbi:DUF4348 domain-containing protein [Mucilaginibacter sp.]|uniref:DUF4348 domain-containing protein n=1 Tax=Mucilaginibacter sp. TaxID=1882438 RepID=UPI0025EE0DDF|nr:DUF4348 domain-containing protein [Mucilaginibacter sp.]